MNINFEIIKNQSMNIVALAEEQVTYFDLFGLFLFFVFLTIASWIMSIYWFSKWRKVKIIKYQEIENEIKELGEKVSNLSTM